MTLSERFTPRTAAGRDGLGALLTHPSRAVLAVDFDGTLAPIVEDPELARALPGALPALLRLAARVDSVIVVTGRPARVAATKLGLVDETTDSRPASGAGRASAARRTPLVVLGHYGRERWDGSTGAVQAPEDPPGVAIARDRLPELIDQTLTSAGLSGEGVSIEDKGSSLAAHTRRAADPEAALTALGNPLTRLASDCGLVIERGRYVLELRPPGGDKGSALTEYLRERDGHAVLYAGDDLGDLAAYDAVEALRAHGVAGLTVCSASTEVSDLERRADLVVPGPPGVVDLLTELADTLDRAEPGRA